MPGFEGLEVLPPIRESHPRATSPETVERIRQPAFLEKLTAMGNQLRAPETPRCSPVAASWAVNASGVGPPGVE